jgi:hypothetical protein
MLHSRLMLLTLAMCASGLAIPRCLSQMLQNSERAQARHASAFHWNLSPEIVQKLSRNVVAGARVSFPVQTRPTPEMIAAAKQRYRVGQSQTAAPASHSQQILLSPGQATLLSPSPAVAGPEAPQTMSTGMLSSTSPSAVSQPQANNVPTAHSSSKLGVEPAGLRCLHPGIDDVSGSNGSTSLIFLEPGKNYVIHGCGFGNQRGEVYLTGVKRQATGSSRLVNPQILGMHQHPDWITLVPAVGADPRQPQAWTNTEIQVMVNSNTSGFFDSYWSATVLVIPAGGKQQIESVPGFGFWAARAEQLLPALPLAKIVGNPKQSGPVNFDTQSWFVPGSANDGAGHPVQPNLLSPSAASLVIPGHTFAVVRDDNAAAFNGGQDELNTSPTLIGLNNGFEVSHIQLFTASLSPTLCPSGSNFSSNGNWNAALRNYADPDKYVVSWQEQSCGSGGVSAYAIDVSVVGPRGITPLFQ